MMKRGVRQGEISSTMLLIATLNYIFKSVDINDMVLILMGEKMNQNEIRR